MVRDATPLIQADLQKRMRSSRGVLLLEDGLPTLPRFRQGWRGRVATIRGVWRQHLGGPNVQAAVHLDRVGGDDLPAQPLRQHQRQLGLAHGRRPRQHHHLPPVHARPGRAYGGAPPPTAPRAAGTVARSPAQAEQPGGRARAGHGPCLCPGAGGGAVSAGRGGAMEGGGRGVGAGSTPSGAPRRSRLLLCVSASAPAPAAAAAPAPAPFLLAPQWPRPK